MIRKLEPNIKKIIKYFSWKYNSTIISKEELESELSLLYMTILTNEKYQNKSDVEIKVIFKKACYFKIQKIYRDYFRSTRARTFLSDDLDYSYLNRNKKYKQAVQKSIDYFLYEQGGKYGK